MYIYGASGHGKVVASVLIENGEQVISFIDDDLTKKQWMGLPVIHSDALTANKLKNLIIAIGNNVARKKVVDRLQHTTYKTVVATSATMAIPSQIAEGTMVMSNAVINIDAHVGKHCIINSAAVVEHDCILGDFVHISPNATLGGNVVVGEGSHIGLGAIVLPGIQIGKWATVGAGAVVTKNVPDGSVVVGVPARSIKL